MSKKYKYNRTFTYEGKRYYIHGDTLEEVAEKKAKKLYALEHGCHIPSSSMTVENWAKICFTTYKSRILDSTRSDMLYRINKHIIATIGRERLQSVTPLQCQQIMNAQAGMSQSHITKLHQELHFLFERAKQNHLILENPADHLILPHGRYKNRRSISDVERSALLEAAEKNTAFTLFLLMLYCGCRPTEASHCIGSDLSLVDGKPMLHIRGTKSHNSNRFVPVPEALFNRIKDTAPDAPIAPNTAGVFHTHATYRRMVTKLRREMNIAMGASISHDRLVHPLPLAEDFVPYCLRHTYCTDLCRMGIDIRIAQKLMGHASIKMTADIYTHVETTDLTDVADIINQRCTLS